MITGSIFFGVLFLLLIGFLYIRAKYNEYDLNETKKESIINMRAKIKQAQDYFRISYDHNVYNNIKLNLDFCLKLILNKDIDSQIIYLNKLFNTLYEVGYRLKTNYDNVIYIIAPMKSLREELVTDQLDYIKENSEGL